MGTTVGSLFDATVDTPVGCLVRFAVVSSIERALIASSVSSTIGSSFDLSVGSSVGSPLDLEQSSKQHLGYHKKLSQALQSP